MMTNVVATRFFLATLGDKRINKSVELMSIPPRIIMLVVILPLEAKTFKRCQPKKSTLEKLR